MEHFLICLFSFLVPLTFLGSFFAFMFLKREAKYLSYDVLDLKKEIELLKERQTKTDNLLKKILEKFPDLANLA